MNRILIIINFKQIENNLCYQSNNALIINIDSLKIKNDVKLLLQETNFIESYNIRKIEKLIRKSHLSIFIEFISREIWRREQNEQIIFDFANRLSNRQKFIIELCRINAKNLKFNEMKTMKRIYTLIFDDFFWKTNDFSKHF